MATKHTQLTWDVPPSGGSDITGYRVLLLQDGTVVATLTPTASPASIEHHATIDRVALLQARNAQGWSAGVAVPVPHGTAPDPDPVAPTLSAVAGNAKVTLNATGGSYDRLELYRNGDLMGEVASFPLDDNDVVNGTRYDYVLKSYNGTAGPIESNMAVAIPAAPASTLVAPTITLNPGDRTMGLSASGGTYDEIVWWRDSINLAPRGGTVNPYTDNFQLSNGTSYEWYCRVFSNTDTEAMAESLHVTGQPGAASLNPTPPTITAARQSADGTKIDIAVTNPGTGTWVQYAVLVNGSMWANPFTAPGYIGGVSTSAVTVTLRATYRVSGVNYTVDSNMVTVAAVAATPATSVSAGLVDDATLITGDGLYTWSTTGKTQTAKENTTIGRARTPIWFKFHLDAAATVSFCGQPSTLGYSTADNATNPVDTVCYLFSGPDGTITDDRLNELTSVGYDDDAGGNGQFLLQPNLQPGWYYLAPTSFGDNSPITNSKLAIKNMPAPTGTTPTPTPTPAPSGANGDQYFNITRNSGSDTLTFRGTPPQSGRLQLFAQHADGTETFYADNITLPYTADMAEYVSTSAKSVFPYWRLRVKDSANNNVELWHSELIPTP